MKTQITNNVKGSQAKVINVVDATFMATLAHQTEEDAIADAFFMAELAREAEEDRIADAMLYL